MFLLSASSNKATDWTRMPRWEHSHSPEIQTRATYLPMHLAVLTRAYFPWIQVVTCRRVEAAFPEVQEAQPITLPSLLLTPTKLQSISLCLLQSWLATRTGTPCRSGPALTWLMD